MSKFKSYREESKTDWGFNATNGEKPDREQIVLGAILRIADGMERTNILLGNSGWCAVRRSIVKIADRGITIHHEHSLILKFHWSIRWPWRQKARRRQRTWRLFRRNAKK